MDEQLQQFVNNYMYLADTRNVSYDNPVTMELQPDTRTFLMVVSFSEPSFSQLPYNVLWICYDENDPWHAKVYRRVDHNQSADPSHLGKKYTWEELTTYDQLYDTDHYYQAVNETPAHELGVSWANVSYATQEKGGLVLNTDDTDKGEVDYAPVVVGDEDFRNSDPRNPTAHNHPDYPRTMVHIKGFYTEDLNRADRVNDDEYFVSFDASQLPENGALFFLTGQNPQRPNEWYGEWRLPSADDVWVDHAHITSANIRIASGEQLPISDNTTITLTADSLYDDATTITDDTTASWSVSPNPAGVIIHPTTGEMTVPDIDGDLVVEITVVCDDKYWPGETGTGTMTINIRDLYEEKIMTALEILGPNSLQEQTSADYQVQATYNDGSTEIVNADSFTSDDDAVAILTNSTLAAQDIVTDSSVNLNASYTHNGTTMNASKPVTVIAEIVPVSLEILGPNAMNELANLDLQAQVTYSDGSTQVILVADSTWGFETPPTDITVTPALNSVNYESTADIDGDDTFTVTVSATVDGQALNNTKDITVVDTTVPKVPSKLTIVGAASINEQTTDHEYTFLVEYTDLTTAVVNADAGTFATSNTVLTTATDKSVDTSLNVIIGQIDAVTDILNNENVDLTASYTENGTTVNAVLDVTIVADPPKVVSLAIAGPTEMDEETSIDLVATATFDNGSTANVSGTAAVNACTWSYVSTATGVTDAPATAAQTFTSGQDIAADENFEVQASVTIDGTTVTANHTVTLKDVPLVPTGIQILGPNSVEENTVANYTFEITFNDGSKLAVDPVNLAEVDNDLVAAITTSGEFTASEVTADTPIRISINHLHSGVPLSDTHDLTITDIPVPVSLEIKGQTSVAEQGNFNYTFEVTYSDGSKVNVGPVDNASSDNAAATFATDGSLTTNDITTDTNIQLSADIVHEGVSLSDTLSVDIVADPIPVSIEILGTDDVAESTSHSYTFEVTMSDASKKLVTADTFTASNANATVTNVATGAVTYADVASDVTTTLTVGYTEQGIPLTDTLLVNIRDIVVPVSLEIIGATSIAEGGVEAYTFQVTMSDNSTKDVTANTASATVGSFNTAGSFSAPANVTDSTVSTLSASYTENGETVNDTHNVTIANTINLPVSLEVTGPVNMNEGTTANLVATVTYEDGSTAVVTGSSTWSKVSGTGASIAASTGVVNAVANVTSDVGISFKASYTVSGTTVEDTHAMSVRNSNNLLTSLAVTGPSSVAEGGSNLNLVATASYEDGSDANVTVPSSWSIISGPGNVNSSGVYTPPASVASDQTARVQASYLEGGITRTDTHDILVTDIPVPQSIAISGATEIDEGAGTISLNAVMTRTDSSNLNVTSNAKSTWSVQSGPGSVNSSGVYTPPADVASDTAVVVRISYTDLGTTVVDTHNITVKNQAQAGYTPRWGVVPEVNNIADYNDAFMGSLSNSMTGNNGEVIRATASSANYLYMAWPESLGFAQLQEEGTGNPGGFDGATDLSGENNFSYNDGAGDSVANANQVYLYNGSTNIGGLRVEIGGVGYIIYRKVTTRNSAYDVTIHEYDTPNRKSQFVS